MHAAPRNRIKRILRTYYPDILWKHVYHVRTRSFNFLYKASDITGRQYFVKSYRNIDTSKLQNEWQLYELLMKNHLSIPRVYANRNDALGSIARNPLTALSVQEYIKGRRYKGSGRLPEKYALKAAQELALLHNATLPNRSKLSMPSPIAREVADGINVYKNILHNLNRTSPTTDRTGRIRDALAARIGAAIDADVVTALKHLKRLPLTVVHGDYAPSNIIFGNDQIYIVDWERTRLYYWQYDLFRAASNFASSGIFTPYDSKKDLTKVRRFLMAYFSRRNKVSQQEIALLKMMPRIYCFIDTFPFRNVFIQDERWAQRYIPQTKDALSWWLANEKDYIHIVDTYYNH